ncbi:MAG: HAMP domain-containing protein [Planctomycetes bacterium]|nr:HAMP domain-containing protein [Planctomycetota bacterium]
MSRFDDLPLRRKLMLVILVTCTLVLLLASAALAGFEIDTFRRTMLRESMVLADIVGKNTQAALTFQDATGATSVLGALEANPEVVAARVHDRDGAAFADYLRTGPGIALAERARSDGHEFLDDHLVMVRPITLDGKRIGTISLWMDLAGMHERLLLFAGIVVLVLIGSLAMAWVLSAYLQRYVSQPILSLADVARTVAERKDYTVRAPPQGGNEVGVLTDAFNHMLTEIYDQNQRLKRQAEELTRSNAELEQFTYVSSHDLKEPLRMVTMYMSLLERRYGASMPPEAVVFLHEATAGGERAQQLIDDILSYSRVDRPGVGRGPVALDVVVAEALANNRAEIDRLRAEVVVKSSLPVVLGERPQLVQLFQNLIGNAVKFHGDVPPRIEISAERAGKEWTLSVRDHGIGIAPHYQERIFDMFQRLHTREEYPGTGIGLSICRKIVVRHSGRLWVESEPGAGANFRFTLPVVGELVVGEPQQAASPTDRASGAAL